MLIADFHALKPSPENRPRSKPNSHRPRLSSYTRHHSFKPSKRRRSRKPRFSNGYNSSSHRRSPKPNTKLPSSYHSSRRCYSYSSLNSLLTQSSNLTSSLPTLPPQQSTYPQKPHTAPHDHAERFQQPIPKSDNRSSTADNEPVTTVTAKMLEFLFKLYTNESKFGGEFYNVLNAKLQIFRNICRKVGIGPSDYRKAYNIMLEGKAKKFYYQYLNGKSYTFDNMITRIRAYFHISENYQLYFCEWRTIMLKNVIITNSDKNLSWCFKHVITKL
jgi:hypothetical protein